MTRKANASKEKTAAWYAENASCPDCDGELDHDGNTIFCMNREACGWIQTLAQVKRNRSLEPREDGNEDEDGDDHVGVGAEEDKHPPEKPPAKKQPEFKKANEPKEERHHVFLDPSKHELDEIAFRLSQYHPIVIDKVCKAAHLMRQAVDALASAKGEVG